MARARTPSLCYCAVSPRPQPLERPLVPTGLGVSRTGVQSCCRFSRRFQHGLGGCALRACGCGPVERYPVALAYRLELLAVFLALHRFFPVLERQHVLVRTDSTAAVAYISRIGGMRSRRMSQLARRLLLWSHPRLKSLRAIHVPGTLNRAADALSRQLLRPGEWRLHPESVQLIWARFGEAQIDLLLPPRSLIASCSFPDRVLSARMHWLTAGLGARANTRFPQ